MRPLPRGFAILFIVAGLIIVAIGIFAATGTGALLLHFLTLLGALFVIRGVVALATGTSKKS